MSTSNNLTDLNNTLFETLQGVRDGSVNRDKALIVSKLSNSIVNVAKTQLMAIKLVKGKVDNIDFFVANAGNPAIQNKDLFTLKKEYAIHIGYNTLGEALASVSKLDFDAGFKAWLNNK